MSVTFGEWKYPLNTYRLRVWLWKEPEGWPAISADLPGLASCGDTEEEALENFKEAARGVLESYLEEGREIPWAIVQAPEGARQRFVVVTCA